MISYISSFFTTTTTPVEVPVVANNPSGPEGPISSIPPELVQSMLSQFDIPLLGKLALVSKKWDKLSSSDDVWKKFENEYEEKAPNLKFKIKTSLKPVYQAIKEMIEERNLGFYCKLAKTLFENIQCVKSIPSKYEDERHFEILLKEENKINFGCQTIFNMCVPKNICLQVNAMGFFFYEDSLKINCTNDNYTPYDEIMGGTGELSFTFSKDYKRLEQERVGILWIKTTFLDTASKF